MQPRHPSTVVILQLGSLAGSGAVFTILQRCMLLRSGSKAPAGGCLQRGASRFQALLRATATYAAEKWHMWQRVIWHVSMESIQALMSHVAHQAVLGAMLVGSSTQVQVGVHL